MQKNVYFLFVLLSAGLGSQAQIKQGSWLLGGDLSVNTQTSAQPALNPYTSASTSIVLSPSLGKAIRDNFVLGFDLNYLHQQFTQVNPGFPNSSSHADAYGVDVFLREYKPLGKEFAFFAQETLGVIVTTGTNNGIQESGNGYALSLGLTPGVAYSVCKKVQLEASLPNLFSIIYDHQKFGVDPDASTQNSFSAGTHLSNALSTVEFGFRFLLGS